jgi:hypothetical protein
LDTTQDLRVNSQFQGVFQYWDPTTYLETLHPSAKSTGMPYRDKVPFWDEHHVLSLHSYIFRFRTLDKARRAQVANTTAR